MEDSNMDSLATIQPGRLEGLNINGIHTFLGIPYAKPPVGPLRWHAPEPPERWEGVRPAKQFGPIAIQTTGACFTLRETRQSEDCLSLNIWTASLDREAIQPVMLWIHGGGNPPCFFAFDLLTYGKDLRTERLLDRKQELRRLL